MDLKLQAGEKELGETVNGKYGPVSRTERGTGADN